MNKSTKLYILYGGPSSEREVSFSSKKYFEKLYSEYSPILVDWLKDFRFNVLGDAIYSEDEFYKKLSGEDCVVIIAGHGEYIEDGYLQQKLDFQIHHISYTGSNFPSCILAMDKVKSQEIVAQINNVKVIPTYSFIPSNFKYSELEKKLINISFPLFLKPNGLGSSLGIYLVKSKRELLNKIDKLPNILYLLQPKIAGIELSVGTVRDGKGFLNLPPTEIKPIVDDFFSWNAKYKLGGSKEITPATVDKKIQNKVKAAANTIHSALGLGYYSRSDFLLSQKQDLYYLETNTLPGMSSTSILPQQLEFSGNVSVFKKGLLQNLC